MVVMMLSACIFFNGSSFYHNIINNAFTKSRKQNYTLEFSVYYSYPGFNQDNYFILSTCLNILLCYACGIFVCGIDLLMSLMAFQIIGHIQILSNDIYNMPKPMKPVFVSGRSRTFNNNLLLEVYDTQENSSVRRKIIQFVEHYRLIFRLVYLVSQLST